MLLIDKTLLKLVKGLWGWILAIVIVRFISLIGTIRFVGTITLYLGSLAEPEASPVPMREAVISAFIYALITLVSRLIQGELEYRCTARARTDLRRQIFSAVMALDVGHIEKIGPVSAITSAVDAVEQMQIYYSTYLPNLIFSMTAPIYLFFQLKNTSLPVAAILLAVSLILLPLNNKFRMKIEQLRKVYYRSVEDMTACYLDSLSGLTTLKLFERDRDRAAVLSEKAEILNRDINKFMKINFTSFLVTEGFIYGAIVAAMYVTGNGLKTGSIHIGSALNLLLLSYSFFSTFRQLMSATHETLVAVSAAAKVEEIFDVDTSRKYDPDARPDPEMFSGIRMENVSFSYEGRHRSVQDISLEIARDKTTALVGISGCGKSTAAALMMRFMDPDRGTLYYEGKNYISMKPEEIRKHIVMVPQTVSIFSGTIRDNLLIAAPDAADAELEAVLEEVSLADWVRRQEKGLLSDVGDAGAKLSGGQKQKIGIARALLTDADTIIFDEATSSIDRDSENEIRKCIDSLAETKTLIIISHRLSSVRSADRIYVLDRGTIAEAGSHEELMKAGGLYHRLVCEQAGFEEET